MDENNQELNQEPIQEEKQETAQAEQQEQVVATQNEQTEPFAAAPNQGVETKFTPLGAINENKTKKKKGKAGVIIFILLLLAAIIGGLAYYYINVYTNTKLIYQQILKTGMSSLAATSEEITTLKARTKLDLDIEVEEDYLEAGLEEILEVINNIDATAEIQMDTNEKKAIAKLESNYEGEELLNAEMLLDAKNKGTYVKLEQFFEDVLEIEMEDDYYEELLEAFELSKETEEDKKSREKIVEILENELVQVIKDEYCSKEKEEITIVDKQVNADKYILKMTYPQMVKEITAIFTNLKNNEEFLNCFDDKEDIKDILEETLEELEFVSEELEDATLTINVYRVGLKQEFVKVIGKVEVDGENIAVEVGKNGNSYDFVLTESGTELFWTSIDYKKLDNNTVELDVRFDAGDIVEGSINIEYGYTINGALDIIDTRDAKTLEDFTEVEQQKVIKELEKSKLYELLEEFSGTSNGENYNDEIELPTDNDAEDEQQVSEIPNNNGEISALAKNISSNGVHTKGGTFIVFATNKNNVAVDMEIEVEYYDEEGKILGSSSDDLMAVGAGQEIAIEMWEAPKNFATYKLYIDAEKTEETEYFDHIEVTHNNNGENVVVQVKNNSKETIEFMTVSVVYYKQGNVVGIADGIASDIKSGRAGNFNIYYPFDSEYEDIEFDNYKVFVTEAYSYNW